MEECRSQLVTMLARNQVPDNEQFMLWWISTSALVRLSKVKEGTPLEAWILRYVTEVSRWTETVPFDPTKQIPANILALLQRVQNVTTVGKLHNLLAEQNNFSTVKTLHDLESLKILKLISRQISAFLDNIPDAYLPQIDAIFRTLRFEDAVVPNKRVSLIVIEKFLAETGKCDTTTTMVKWAFIDNDVCTRIQIFINKAHPDADKDMDFLGEALNTRGHHAEFEDYTSDNLSINPRFQAIAQKMWHKWTGKTLRFFADNSKDFTSFNSAWLMQISKNNWKGLVHAEIDTSTHHATLTFTKNGLGEEEMTNFVYLKELLGLFYPGVHLQLN